MAGYSPLKITGMQTGLVQERENFILPDDAYPTLQNAYVWRERIKRKRGYQLLGRLRRELTDVDLGLSGASPWTFNIFTLASITEANAQLDLGSIVIYVDTGAASTGTIINYNNTSNCEVFCSAPHGLTTGDIINIFGVVSTEPNMINGGPYVISVVSATSFTINTSSRAWGRYISGGTWEKENATSILIDQGDGTLETDPISGVSGVINYISGDITISGAGAGLTTEADFSYFPGLPVMGINLKEINNSSVYETIFFDQVYAYIYNAGTGGFEEYIPGTTWNAHGADVKGTDFFWSTNYWVSSLVLPGTATPFFTTTNIKLFWVTNNTGQFGSPDPIRITDGETWVDFVPPNFGQINPSTYLVQCLALIPFRGRLLAFNTYEGAALGTGIHYSNRIRWSTIGNPFIPFSAGPPATGSWRDDIRGQGGFLDIPTSENIVSIGFVRDNLVIFCERSTWQLRYTGRSIAPFQIEKVNSEIGSEGTFSSIQFDTSLLVIGDKGIVECDSYKSERIDIKIPDFVFKFNASNNSDTRIHGVRDFINRLAYWTIPYIPSYDGLILASDRVYPNQRIVYNYENDSWALFNDSLTTLGTFQILESRTWLNTKKPWIECNFPWINQPQGVPSIVGGNQQGFVEYLDELTTNDVSLFITDITANSPDATVVTSPHHNMNTEFVISISGIPTGSPFDNLNGQVFGIILGDNLNNDPANKFRLMKYDPVSMDFSNPQVDVPGDPYIGGGLIAIRENFNIVSKKFNFLDEGQAIQLGFIDILMKTTEIGEPGAISLNVYLDYNDIDASNTLPMNEINDAIPSTADAFFNSVIPTAQSTLSNVGGTKLWQRVFCATRANFLTLEYTFSNAQMAGEEQTKDVEIDAQILWLRRGGRMTTF